MINAFSESDKTFFSSWYSWQCVCNVCLYRQPKTVFVAIALLTGCQCHNNAVAHDNHLGGSGPQTTLQQFVSNESLLYGLKIS